MVLAPFKEAVDTMLEAGGEALRLCYQCGLCTGTCPWNLVTDFQLRKLIHKAQLGVVDFEDEEVWRCVACELCVDRCPRGVDVVHLMRALRRVVMEVGAGIVPHSLRVAVKNLSAVGNPLGEPPEKRTDWAKDLEVKTFTKGTEILYFPCCYQAYDSSNQRVARAAVSILKKADVDFGILGDVVCCGESIRKAGAESLYQNLVRANISRFNESGVKKIVVTSPHCRNAFDEDYPELGGKFEVLHFAQYLAELIKDGRLKLTKELNKRVTYHDSCCFGRHAGIYDEPRQVLGSIPGLELVDMRDTREYALCCGGGCAGRMWMETKKGERFSDLRIEQAVETGASVLAVPCPYCMINFEDTLLAGKGDVIQVKDISELVQEAI